MVAPAAHGPSSPGDEAPSPQIAAVLVVEDDPDLAAAISATLSEEHYAVRVAASGEEALEIARREHLDAALVDLLLPGIGGRELCESLRGIDPDIGVLVITALGSPDEVLAGFEAGADDYLVKPFGLAEMRARLHALLRRGARPARLPRRASATRTETEVLALGDLRLDPASGQAWSDAGPIGLRPREIALLELLLRRPGLVLTRKTVRAALWGPDTNVTDAAVDHHLSSLRRALDAARARCVIETVYGIGWRLREREG